MKQFIREDYENHSVELLIDTQLFEPTVAMKAAYVFLDRAYFFFSLSWEGLVVQIQPKNTDGWDAKKFANEYSDELLAMLLRVKVENENKVVRETIVKRALGSYADLPNFKTVDLGQNPSSQIDFDKDIDEILKEIENDPDLKIDEDEINKILAEIEEEEKASKKPTLDINKLKDVKKNFQR